MSFTHFSWALKGFCCLLEKAATQPDPSSPVPTPSMCTPVPGRTVMRSTWLGKTLWCYGGSIQTGIPSGPVSILPLLIQRVRPWRRKQTQAQTTDLDTASIHRIALYSPPVRMAFFMSNYKCFHLANINKQYSLEGHTARERKPPKELEGQRKTKS